MEMLTRTSCAATAGAPAGTKAGVVMGNATSSAATATLDIKLDFFIEVVPLSGFLPALGSDNVDMAQYVPLLTPRVSFFRVSTRQVFRAAAAPGRLSVGDLEAAARLRPAAAAAE